VSRFRNEEGFSLPELLIALAIAMIVSLATFALIETTMKKSGDAAARVEAAQRGRVAMDVITRQLRSQVCITSNSAAMFEATGNSNGFYVDFTDQSNSDAPPVRHRLVFDPAARTIVEEDTPGVSNHATPPTFTYNLAQTKRKILLTDVEEYHPTKTTTTPVFQYFAYDNSVANPRPNTLLPAPATGMIANDLARVARIIVTYRSLATGHVSPTGIVDRTGSIVMQDEIYVRSADPNDPAPTPTCA
jgi:prepilin-type N-terminal cleavage/methylation domain-containing protein